MGGIEGSTSIKLRCVVNDVPGGKGGVGLDMSGVRVERTVTRGGIDFGHRVETVTGQEYMQVRVAGSTGEGVGITGGGEG